MQAYDEPLAAFQKASVKLAGSLALLNWGQNILVSCGLMAIMYMASREIIDGKKQSSSTIML